MLYDVAVIRIHFDLESGNNLSKKCVNASVKLEFSIIKSIHDYMVSNVYLVPFDGASYWIEMQSANVQV